MAFSGIFTSPVHHKVVLFIAPQEDTLLEYHALARSGGFEAELARDGYEGLLLAHLARPDLVVLDLRDPELDGRWIVQRLRSSVGTRALPLIIVGVPGDSILDVTPEGAGRLHVVDRDESLRLLHVVRALLVGPSQPEGAVG
jgi:CheY-like chemotaxis protein